MVSSLREVPIPCPADVFIGIGANLDPEDNIRRALACLAEATRIQAVSTMYRTSPLGGRNQPDFINGVVRVHTPLPPLALRNDVLRRIEWELGRRRTADPCADRPIDLDLLLYGDVSCAREGLILPAPDLLERPFIALPMRELAPDLRLPGQNRTLADLTDQIPAGSLIPLPDFSARLRTAIG